MCRWFDDTRHMQISLRTVREGTPDPGAIWRLHLIGSSPDDDTLCISFAMILGDCRLTCNSGQLVHTHRLAHNKSILLR